MAKVKLSQWHNGNVKPVHVGVYERKDPNGEQFLNRRNNYSWWNGKQWIHCSDNISEAIERHTYGGAPSRSQNLQWRGIVK